jgi:hypothetical protein
MTTLRGARESLGATLTAALSGSYMVMDFEPKPGGLTKPTYVTLGAAGITPTEYQIAVRCYSDTSKGSLDVALDRVQDMVDAVEGAMPSSIPRGNWTLEWDELQNAYVGTLIAEFPRDDF